MKAKNSPTTCDSRALKAYSKTLHAQSSAFAFQSQISDLRVTHFVVRFGLAPSMAAIVAQHAFNDLRAA